MLKNLINTLRGSDLPLVWWGRDRDIWPDPDAPDYGWYCGECGHNRGGLAELEAERAADDHARTHTGVTVERLG